MHIVKIKSALLMDAFFARFFSAILEDDFKLYYLKHLPESSQPQSFHKHTEHTGVHVIGADHHQRLSNKLHQ